MKGLNMSDQMIDNWLKSNEPKNCDGSNHTTLERNISGKITGRRDSIKTVKKAVKSMNKSELYRSI